MFYKRVAKSSMKRNKKRSILVCALFEGTRGTRNEQHEELFQSKAESLSSFIFGIIEPPPK